MIDVVCDSDWRTDCLISAAMKAHLFRLLIIISNSEV